MRKLILATLGTAFIAGSASAAAPPPSITYTNGVYGIPSYTSAKVFEEFSGGTPGTQYNPATQAMVAGESVTGDVQTAVGSQAGQELNPDGGGDNYLAVKNGTFSVALGAGVQFFSFVFGSLDSYNSLTLGFADGSSQLFTGLGIINGSSQNTPTGLANTSYGLGGRVSYNANGAAAITSAVFGSTTESFEIDALAAATPEPGTWLMMILGFGLVGGALRVRRRQATIAFA